MSSIKGTFQNGIARPLEPVSEEHEGQEVVIMFPDEKPSPSTSTNGAEWNALTELLDNCAVDLDTPDLADEHDHYLYGKPKKN
jgi:hypothetical protein